jgi:hypothetical protein
VSHRRTGTRPSLVRALALIALLFFAGIADSIHESQAAHAICPEHGEIIHVATRTQPAPTAHLHAHDCGQPLVLPGAPDAEHHDHCVLWSFVRASSVALMSRAAPSLWIEEPIVARAPERETIRRDGVPLLLLAPKHSPPVS